MKVSRQPKVSALLRIFAGTCALLWFVGIAICGVGRVCRCADNEGACAADAGPAHEHDAVSSHEQRHAHDAEHHHDAEAHQHAMASHHPDVAMPEPCAGKNGCKDTRCCSTIQAFITTITPVVLPKPISQSVLSFSLLSLAREYVLTAPPSTALCQVKPRDWVFTPEVCLGPAFHSLAPPVFV